MKNNPTDRMKDPFYAGLLFKIEQIICQVDDEAKRQGLELTDSQIRSALVKARKKVAGEDPDIPEATERDKILAMLIDGLFQAPDDIMEQISGADVRIPVKVATDSGFMFPLIGAQRRWRLCS